MANVSVRRGFQEKDAKTGARKVNLGENAKELAGAGARDVTQHSGLATVTQVDTVGGARESVPDGLTVWDVRTSALARRRTR